ncbi:hypothetical protein H0H92_007436 [Tricholoma furcatifolium]|nr:hypothetical protein H0H92_007436 [Tricholoma furcatifolium]
MLMLFTRQWADDVKYESGYTWSQPLHFVDAEDSPPTSCSVSESRDCSDGQCIRKLRYGGTFIGDISQPLHVEAYEVGGNDIDVKCSVNDDIRPGVIDYSNALFFDTYVESDTGMIEKLLAANYSDSVTTWASSLTTRIQSGDYASVKASWISCSSTTETLSSRTITPLECPLVWAQDSNSFDCSYVFSYVNYSDLCTSAYYTGAVPIIEEQIAKSGYRLAAWLNVLFDDSVSLP